MLIKPDLVFFDQFVHLSHDGMTWKMGEASVIKITGVLGDPRRVGTNK